MLGKDFYENKYPIFANFIRRHRLLKTGFYILYYGIPVLMIIIYCVFLIKVYKDYGRKALKKALVIPAIAFFVVSIFRKFFNRKRPYEKYNFKPLIPKKKKGSSMPSRHTFSAGIIAAAISIKYPILAPFIWCLTILIAILRVLGGVHHVMDAVVAIVLAFGTKILLNKIKDS